MKRWQNIVASAGFVLLLAFVADRVSQARLLWVAVSWSDLRIFGHSLAVAALFVLEIVAVPLVMIAMARGGYLLWKENRPRPLNRRLPAGRRSQSTDLLVTNWRHAVKLSVLSAFSGLASALASLMGSSRIGLPGWWVTGWVMNLHGGKSLHDVRLLIMLAVFVNSTLCFAVLWSGYVLFTKAQEKSV